MRDVMLFLHIVAAMAWIGAALREMAADGLVARSSAVVRAATARITVEMGRRIYGPAAGVVLVSGIWLVTLNDAFSFGSAFVSIGFLAIIVGIAFGPGIYGRRWQRAAELHEAGDTAGAEQVEESMRPFRWIEIVVLLVTVLAMVMKWGI